MALYNCCTWLSLSLLPEVPRISSCNSRCSGAKGNPMDLSDAISMVFPYQEHPYETNLVDTELYRLPMHLSINEHQVNIHTNYCISNCSLNHIPVPHVFDCMHSKHASKAHIVLIRLIHGALIYDNYIYICVHNL